MRQYEITTILRDGSNSNLDTIKSAIKDILSKNSVEISSQEDWGSKKLWHRIDKQESGFYTHIKCKANPTSISQIEHDLRLNQDILRTLVVRT